MGLFLATSLEAQCVIQSAWCRIIKKTLDISQLDLRELHLSLASYRATSFLSPTLPYWGPEVHLQIPTDSKVTGCWAVGITQQLQTSGTLNPICLVPRSLLLPP